MPQASVPPLMTAGSERTDSNDAGGSSVPTRFASVPCGGPLPLSFQIAMSGGLHSHGLGCVCRIRHENRRHRPRHGGPQVSRTASHELRRRAGRGHGAVRGAAPRLRPRAPVRVLRRQDGRRPVAGRARLLRAQRLHAAPGRARRGDRPRRNNTVTTADGEVLPYDKLVLATGSYPFVPPVPGRDRADCFVYRTIEDLEAMQECGAPLEDRRGRRRRPAGPGMRQGAARHGPAKPTWSSSRRA